jgi:hypothetical protein
MHARAQIRYAVVDLVTGLPTTGQRVYPSRVFSLDETDLPSTSVFTKGEDVSTNAPSITQRKISLVLEGHAIVDELIDDVLDQIAAELEQAMAGSLVVAGQTLTAQLQQTEFEFLGDSETKVGLVRLTYLVPYATRRATPDSLSI